MPEVDFVAFTGSVDAGGQVDPAGRRGRALHRGGAWSWAARTRATCAPTPTWPHAIENLTDGAFFNAGQSCCGIERIYVARGSCTTTSSSRCAPRLVSCYRLGNPTDPDSNLGPLVRTSAAEFVRGQIAEAQEAGAKALIETAGFPADAPGTPYLAPQILVDVDHTMRVMTEETFGPAVGIMKVASDEEAVALMNDSAFGLTAVVCTQGRGRRRSHRRSGGDRDLVHEPLRLPGPGAGLDRGEELGPRLQSQCRRLRTADAPEVLSSENHDLVHKGSHDHDR